MSMLPQNNSLNGYYDDNGHWQTTKKCFMNCGANCDCSPPHGLYYVRAKDKRKTKGKDHE